MPICALCDPLIVVSCSGPPSEFEFSLLVTPPVMLRERIEIAIDERQVEDLVLTDGARQRGGVGLDERRVGDDRDDFGHRAGLDAASTRALRPTSSRMPVCDEVLEAAQRDFELVVADGQQRQRILAFGIGHRRARNLRAEVGGGDLSAGHPGAGVSLTFPRIVPVATCACSSEAGPSTTATAKPETASRPIDGRLARKVGATNRRAELGNDGISEPPAGQRPAWVTGRVFRKAKQPRPRTLRLLFFASQAAWNEPARDEPRGLDARNRRGEREA